MILKLTDEQQQALQQHNGGPVRADGADASYVVMSMDVYRELMGVGSETEFAASVEAIKEGLEDVRQGRTRPLREFLDELGREHEVSR